MQTRLRQLAVAAALTFGASAVAAMPAMAQQDENHEYKGTGSAQTQRTNPDTYASHPDYSNNEYYRTGNDEGYRDYQGKKQLKHEHQYRSDDDRKAYENGYKEGWSGRSYRDNDNKKMHDKDDDHEAH
ncbi:MAG TPA: hypothetical protein VHU44_06640 [Acidobacteriaceae bacterium]|jgi:hypothetical protein|nr:hypothetical protein [Acidobacteriaceae bacterium]